MSGTMLFWERGRPPAGYGERRAPSSLPERMAGRAGSCPGASAAARVAGAERRDAAPVAAAAARGRGDRGQVQRRGAAVPPEHPDSLRAHRLGQDNRCPELERHDRSGYAAGKDESWRRIVMGVVGWYYLHENGELIYKPETGGTVADLRESDLVRMMWPVDPADRVGAWCLLVEALALGASKERVSALAGKWGCTDQDASEYAKRVGARLYMDGDAWCATRVDFQDLQASPAGFGSTAIEALAALCKALGYEGGKLWGATFQDLLKVEWAAADTDLVHLPSPLAGQVVWVPLCGAVGPVPLSPQRGQVTCSECLRLRRPEAAPGAGEPA